MPTAFQTPDAATVLLGPDGGLNRDAIADCQPNRRAVRRPTMTPVRVRNHASYCSGGRILRYMSARIVGIDGIWAKKFLGSW